MFNHHFYCCLIIIFIDLAVESSLHKNLDDFLTILRVDFQFQDLNPIRFVNSNFWIQLDFSSSKIGLESSRFGSSIRLESSIRLDAISLIDAMSINNQNAFNALSTNFVQIKTKLNMKMNKIRKFYELKEKNLLKIMS